MDLGLKLLTSNICRLMKNIRSLCLKKRAALYILCQIYDQDSDKQYNSIFREDTSFLHLWIHVTRGVLNSWCLVNVGIQDINKLPREYIGYLPSIMSTCTPNTVSLSCNGMIASNHFPGRRLFQARHNTDHQ